MPDEEEYDESTVERALALVDAMDDTERADFASRLEARHATLTRIATAATGKASSSSKGILKSASVRGAPIGGALHVDGRAYGISDAVTMVELNGDNAVVRLDARGFKPLQENIAAGKQLDWSHKLELEG